MTQDTIGKPLEAVREHEVQAENDLKISEVNIQDGADGKDKQSGKRKIAETEKHKVVAMKKEVTMDP